MEKWQSTEGKRRSGRQQNKMESTLLSDTLVQHWREQPKITDRKTIILEQIGRKVEISLTDSLFGFYKRNKGEN